MASQLMNQIDNLDDARRRIVEAQFNLATQLEAFRANGQPQPMALHLAFERGQDRLRRVNDLIRGKQDALPERRA